MRAGLMPAFTRAALAPALARFAKRYPQVSVQVTEAYSGTLSDMVRSDELDFALVPAGLNDAALRVSMLCSDTEMLVSSPSYGLKPLQPVQLKELAPLKLIVPGKSNVRRANLQRYLDTHQVQIESLIEMDAMIGTLELIARSDWVAILPGLILSPDQKGKERVINPIANPRMGAEFVVIEPARSKLSRPANLFLEEMRTEVNAISQQWAQLI
jgi:DNA-binding transcriptional LysR family regulator